MRVAVLGGTGFIGRHVTRRLAEAGHDVVAITRGRTPSDVPGARALAADRRDPAALAAALTEAAAPVVVDMIAYAAADVETLLPALPDATERLVVVSSGDVYRTYDAFRRLAPADVPPAPLSETAPLRERLHPYRAQAKGPDDLLYSYEKILVERTARAGTRAVTVLRLPMVYGPGDPQRRVEGYLDRLRASPALLRLNAAEAAWRCTRGYVEDVAAAIALAATDERARGRTFNVGEPDAPAEIEWVRAVADAAGWGGRVAADPDEPPSLPAEWSVPLATDTGLIREVMGYEEPVGRAEGLRRTVKG